MSNKILMNCIPNRNILLKIQQIQESINNFEQILKILINLLIKVRF